jgi:hypothetical protein
VKLRSAKSGGISVGLLVTVEEAILFIIVSVKLSKSVLEL